MTPEQLSETIVDALAALVADGAITLPDGVPTQVTVERPRQKGHGDYATNVAIQLAKKAGTNPRAFAELVAGAAARRRRHRRRRGRRARASSTSPSRRVPRARSRPTSSRRARRTAPPTRSPGEKINLEFVSANPTGPLHLGGVRWAAVGDALGRIFDKTGAEVTREYYFNDHGAQIDRFSSSLLAQRPGPAGARGRLRRRSTSTTSPTRSSSSAPTSRTSTTPRRRRSSAQVGVDMMFAEIKQSLHDFGVDFDVYFHEKSLHDSGAVERAIDAADRDGQHLHRGRRALAAHREVRRRQGPRDHPVQRHARLHLRRPRPTTSTSASAASTAASSCSAPTTTATSAG